MKILKSWRVVPVSAKCLFLGVCMLALVPVAKAQTTAAEWQAKAYQEYPDLAKSDSALSTKYKARVTELMASDPNFFSDPKWPYTLAQSLADKPK